jgi:hypothetical protein
VFSRSFVLCPSARACYVPASSDSIPPALCNCCARWKKKGREEVSPADALQHGHHRRNTASGHAWAVGAHFLGILALPPISHGDGRKIKQPALPPVLGRLCAEMLVVVDGQQAIPGARHHPQPTGLHRARLGEKKQLRVGAARWLCSGHRSERSVWLGGYDRVLLASAGGADLPHRASAAGQTGRGRARQKRSNRAGGRQC